MKYIETTPKEGVQTEQKHKKTQEQRKRELTP